MPGFPPDFIRIYGRDLRCSMHRISTNKLLLLSLGTLFLFVAVPLLPTTSASTPNPGGLIVPLYMYPNSSWTALIQQKLANPSIPVIAVVNPGNGPGSTRDPNYASWIDKLTSSGIVVVGYISTEYGAVSISAVESQISTYKSWYAVSGIFLDEMSNVNGLQSYYSTVTAYARSLGMYMVVGNPGTDVPSSFLGIVNVLVVFENPYLPSVSRLQMITMGQTRDDFAVMCYDVSQPSQSTVDTITHYARYVYLTSGSVPAPYSTMPTYFSTLVSRLVVS